MGYSMLHAGGGQRLERVRECSVPYFVKNVNAIKGKTQLRGSAHNQYRMNPSCYRM